MEYIIGVAISLLMQAIKRFLGTNAFGTNVALFIVSLAVAGLYVALAGTAIWDTAMQVFVTASAFHNIIIRRVEDEEDFEDAQ